MNLKQAARTLGIHYQTAYKLVRSGRLAAVRVGGVYEVSDAAIDAYLAEKDALRRAPVRVDRRSPARALGEMIRDVETALDTPGVTAAPVLELVADTLATHLGDLVVIQLTESTDVDGRGGGAGPHFVLGPVRHVNPRRRAIIAANAERYPLAHDQHPIGVVVTSGQPMLLPHVRQEAVRTYAPPDLIQHLDEGGVHSFIAAPATSGDRVLGVVLTTRDAPGRPYTEDDAALVGRLARLAGAAIRRGQLAGDANRRREVVMERIARRLEPDQLVTDDETMAEAVCDADGRIVAANDMVTRLTGVPEAELLGRELVSLVVPAERERQGQAVKRLLVGEVPYIDVRRTLLRNVEHEITVVGHHGVVRDAAADPLGIAVVAYELD